MAEIGYGILLDIALILFTTKIIGIFMQKLGLPQVVGCLIGGLIIGPAMLGLVQPNNMLVFLAEIGVIMIMFSAGMETDLKTLKKNASASISVTLLGVIVPLALGFIVAALFNGGFSDMTKEQALSNVFYGVILTATSVSITVAALKEMGKLNTKVGAVVLSAAILDDIIGIFILTFVLSLNGSGASASQVGISTLLFFVFSIVLGVIARKIFKMLSNRYPHTQRMPIFGLVFALVFAYVAEVVFGIADITGAFFAGVILSNLSDTKYIERKIDINSYMIFSPIFFANIGINTSFEGFDISTIWFGLAFVAVGILSKLIGSFAGAKMCKFSNVDSYRVGLGMVARAEVALIVASKGISAGLATSSIMPIVLMLVIVTSLLTPILLRLSYRKEIAIPMLQPAHTPMENTEDYDDFIVEHHHNNHHDDHHKNKS